MGNDWDSHDGDGAGCLRVVAGWISYWMVELVVGVCVVGIAATLFVLTRN